MKETEDQTGIQVVSATLKATIRTRPGIVEPEKSQKPEAIELEVKRGQPTVEEPYAPAKEEPETNKKAVPLEQVHISEEKHVEIPQQKTIEAAPTQQLKVETGTVPPSSSGCQYGFGYLSQREKGEGIPSLCIECPKLLNCMLSKYYKSGESVKQINKWYKL